MKWMSDDVIVVKKCLVMYHQKILKLVSPEKLVGNATRQNKFDK